MRGSGRGIIQLLSRNLPGRTRENLNEDSRSPERELNSLPLEYKTEVLTTLRLHIPDE